MLFYGVISIVFDEAFELFLDRQHAEQAIENWDRDEPDRAGELYVEAVEFEFSLN